MWESNPGPPLPGLPRPEFYGTDPPVPPPKPNSHPVSRISTPTMTTTQSPRRPPPRPDEQPNLPDAAAAAQAQIAPPPSIPDPGDQWLPKYLQDKSIQDLSALLSTPALLSALNHSPATAHASLAASHRALSAALADNLALAAHLAQAGAQLADRRDAAQAQLLATHALERAWRAKQAALDAALAPFAPASLYQRLAAAGAEQAAVCRALEESFLEFDGPGPADAAAQGGEASEREVAEWVRRYREAKKLHYLRAERKERWDEGRVGGWR